MIVLLVEKETDWMSIDSGDQNDQVTLISIEFLKVKETVIRRNAVDNTNKEKEAQFHQYNLIIVLTVIWRPHIINVINSLFLERKLVLKQNSIQYSDSHKEKWILEIFCN